jgi:Type I phosphodiesterase / nucleotide pyrophosphatase
MTRESRRVCFVLIDGARADLVRDLLDRGDLPNLARHVVEPGGFTVGATVFPSTTGVAYLPFLYGVYPGTANIPGIRWLDRTGATGGWRAQWRAARSYCGVQAGWLNDDLQAGPSIFELVPESLGLCTPLTRGLRPGALRLAGKRALLGSLAHYFGTYQALDDVVAEAWIRVAQEPWRFLFVVFPGPDGITHLTDPFHPRVLASYRAVDAALGRFVDRARFHGDVPALFVASDHGGSVMREHRDIALELEGLGWPTLRHPVHVWKRAARAAVMVSGNGSVQVYFAPRSGRPTALAGPDLPADVVNHLLDLPAVRLAAWRDGGAGGGVTVAAGTGRARLVDDGGRVRYEPLSGDPLGLGSASLVLEDRALLGRTLAGELPDGPRQLLQLFRSPRAGDLVLAARLGSDFRGPWEIPEHRAGHGSLITDHMAVPIAASVPLPDAPLRTVDLMPTMLELLGEAVPPGLDGVPFSRLAQGAGALA